MGNFSFCSRKCKIKKEKQKKITLQPEKAISKAAVQQLIKIEVLA